jgi:hypothetical protein
MGDNPEELNNHRNNQPQIVKAESVLVPTVHKNLNRNSRTKDKKSSKRKLRVFKQINKTQ